MTWKSFKLWRENCARAGGGKAYVCASQVKKTLYVSVHPVSPYMTDLPSAHKIEHILTERYEDTTPLGGYVKLVDADILWVATGSSWSRCSMVACYACSARTYHMHHFIRDFIHKRIQHRPGRRYSAITCRCHTIHIGPFYLIADARFVRSVSHPLQPHTEVYSLILPPRWHT